MISHVRGSAIFEEVDCLPIPLSRELVTFILILFFLFFFVLFRLFNQFGVNRLLLLIFLSGVLCRSLGGLADTIGFLDGVPAEVETAAALFFLLLERALADTLI